MPLIKPKFAPGVIKDDTTLAAEGGWTDCDKIRFVDGKPQVIGGSQELSVTGGGNDTYTKVLLHCDGADASTTFTDTNVGGSAHTWTAAGNAQIDTAQSKFGGASGLFDGTGDWVTTPDHADFALGTSNFTIDAWVRPAVDGATVSIFGQCDNAGADLSIAGYRNASNKVVIDVGIGGGFALTSTSNVLAGSWTHVAIVRNGSGFALYINGTSEATATNAGSVTNSASAFRIGAYGEVTTNPHNGWIDEFRLSVGIARWTTTFTPPESAYSTSDALPARGAIAWADNDGSTYLAWGSGTGLFVMHLGAIHDITPTDFTPESISGPSPYGGGDYGEGIYGRGNRVIWHLAQWGEKLLASPRGGKLYEWSLDTDVPAAVVTNAPTTIDAFFVSPERIVVLLGTTEFGGSYNAMLVRWSDQGDNTQWTPATTNLAGEFPLASGSKLVSGLAARGLNLVWSDTTAYTMQFTGSVSSVFVIRPAGYGCGLIGPHAKAASDSAVYWMSRDNFHIFNGQSTSDIPCTLRQDIFNNLYPNNEEKCHAFWNTAYGETWFSYPDFRDGTGEPSRYATVNTQGQWAPGTYDRTTWIPAGIFPYPIAFSADTRGIFYQDVPNAGDSNSTLDAYLESGFIDVGDGDTLYLIKRIVPDFHNQGPTVSISLKTKLWPNQSETTNGPYSATTTTEKLNMRVKARQIAVRLASTGAPNASFWELGAIGFDSQQSGEKR